MKNCPSSDDRNEMGKYCLVNLDLISLKMLGGYTCVTIILAAAISKAASSTGAGIVCVVEISDSFQMQLSGLLVESKSL